MSVGLDRLVDDFALDSLAYYHRGLDGESFDRELQTRGDQRPVRTSRNVEHFDFHPTMIKVPVQGIV